MRIFLQHLTCVAGLHTGLVLTLVLFIVSCGGGSGGGGSTSGSSTVTTPKYTGPTPSSSTTLNSGTADQSSIATGIVDGWKFSTGGVNTVVSLFDVSGASSSMSWGVFSDAAYTTQLDCEQGDFPSGASLLPRDCLIVNSNGAILYIAVSDQGSGGTFYSVTADSDVVESSATSAYTGSTFTSVTPGAVCMSTAVPGGAAQFGGVAASGTQYYYLTPTGPCNVAGSYTGTFDVAIVGVGNVASYPLVTVYSDAFTTPLTCGGTSHLNQGAGKPQDCVVTAAGTGLYIKITETAGQNTQFLLTVD
jgi:hypothetical protein